MWGRGLKLDPQGGAVSAVAVAPCVGAWVEIGVLDYCFDNDIVAPCVGAWVEIFSSIFVCSSKLCRPLCGGVG